MVALPGVYILPEEELDAEFGKIYRLDHLPELSVEARLACLMTYKYKPPDLSKACLNPDSVHPILGAVHTAIPLCAPNLPTAPLHSFFPHEETVLVHSIFRLHFSLPSSPRFAYI